MARLARTVGLLLAMGMILVTTVGSLSAQEAPAWRKLAPPSAAASTPAAQPQRAEAGQQVFDYTDRAPTKNEVRDAFYGNSGRLPMTRAIRIGQAPAASGDGQRSRPAHSDEGRRSQPASGGGAAGIAVKIEFRFDSSAILPEYAGHLEGFGQVLADDPALAISIVGHADAHGDADYNYRLSERRAKSVKQFLVQLYQIDPARIAIRGDGEARPAFHPPTNPKNRRVEFFRQ